VIEQTIHVAMRGGAVSAWHRHRHCWDYCSDPYLARYFVRRFAQRSEKALGEHDLYGSHVASPVLTLDSLLLRANPSTSPGRGPLRLRHVPENLLKV
jgi:hypothetical protein